ncbi:MAG: class II fructose-bisphosphate aldolase [Treponema sp.]|jgi:ketose-bisphosphate aldolase|nr:class II fructose-bisphosphate aldolase [Treponema sp.]
MLVTLNEMLPKARKERYAVPAFDVGNYEMVRAVIEVCDQMRSPALFMCLKPDLEGNGLGFLSEMIRHAAKIYDAIPVCLHLDHATDLEDIKKAIDAGFTSVMYDGSTLPFEKNAKNTKEVVIYAHQRGISTEAELGHVTDAIAGSGESALTGCTEEDIENALTNVDEVKEFIRITDVDCLAVAIGTAHGVYVKSPFLRLDRLEKINSVSVRPLVLHGGSGTPDDDIRKAISLGITKINIFSEVLNGLNSGLKEKLNGLENMSSWPSVVYKKAISNMKEVIRRKIEVFGSVNRI